MIELKHVSPREAYASYVRGGVIVDVREHEKNIHKTLDINNLVEIPASEIDRRFAELPHNRPLVLVSRVGNSSSTAAKFLLEHGYPDVAVVDGGLAAWEDEGLPVRDEA